MFGKRTGGCCSAIGCSMRRNTNLLSKVKMYRFPADPVRRAAWCRAVRRQNWTANNNSLLCNAHFVTGKPSYDPEHPDYIPSIFSFNKHNDRQKVKLLRYERSVKRRELITGVSSTENVKTTPDDSDTSSDANNTLNQSNIQVDTVQTDMSFEDITNLEKENNALQEENYHFKKKINFTTTYDLMANRDETAFVQFYTRSDDFLKTNESPNHSEFHMTLDEKSKIENTENKKNCFENEMSKNVSMENEAYPLSFDCDNQPDRIIGATYFEGELMFIIKWKGCDEGELISSKIANVKCPQVVINFYEERLIFRGGYPFTRKRSN